MTKRRLYWLTCCVSMGLLYLFENNTATRVLLWCTIGLPAVAMLMVPLAARRMTIEMQAPQCAAKHEEISVCCRIQCTVPLIAFHVRLRCRNQLTGEERETVFLAQNQGKKTHAQFGLYTANCGMLALEADVTARDCFGLSKNRKSAKRRVYILVAPQLRDLEITLDEDKGAGSEAAEIISRMNAETGETIGVREYMPGDPIRLIHWKLSQKTDAVLLRELAQPISDEIVLIFDMFTPTEASAPSPAMTDALAETFLSLSRMLLSMGIPNSVCWQPAGRNMTEYRRLEKEEDWAEWINTFFSDSPTREFSIALDELAQSFSHVIWIGGTLANAESICAIGKRITVITGEEELQLPEEIQKIVVRIQDGRWNLSQSVL